MRFCLFCPPIFFSEITCPDFLEGLKRTRGTPRPCFFKRKQTHARARASSHLHTHTESFNPNAEDKSFYDVRKSFDEHLRAFPSHYRYRTTDGQNDICVLPRRRTPFRITQRGEHELFQPPRLKKIFDAFPENNRNAVVFRQMYSFLRNFLGITLRDCIISPTPGVSKTSCFFSFNLNNYSSEINSL